MSKTLPAPADIRDLYRVVYTTPAGEEMWGEPQSRELAMQNFDLNLESSATVPFEGKERIRVLAESEWRRTRALAGGAA